MPHVRSEAAASRFCKSPIKPISKFSRPEQQPSTLLAAPTRPGEDLALGGLLECCRLTRDTCRAWKTPGGERAPSAARAPPPPSSHRARGRPRKQAHRHYTQTSSSWRAPVWPARHGPPPPPPLPAAALVASRDSFRRSCCRRGPTTMGIQLKLMPAFRLWVAACYLLLAACCSQAQRELPFSRRCRRLHACPRHASRRRLCHYACMHSIRQSTCPACQVCAHAPRPPGAACPLPLPRRRRGRRAPGGRPLCERGAPGVLPCWGVGHHLRSGLQRPGGACLQRMQLQHRSALHDHPLPPPDQAASALHVDAQPASPPLLITCCLPLHALAPPQAEAVCAQLGFQGRARTFGGAAYGAGTGRQWLDRVYVSGSPVAALQGVLQGEHQPAAASSNSG